MNERKRILVVDDKESMVRLFEKILGEGYQVTPAFDGARAIALLSAQSFDAVVTDVRMPGADGLEVLKAAKARAPETEVVIMTAFASVQSAVEAIKLGAYDYLQKPFDPDEAAIVVARAVERKELREQAASLKRELAGRFGPKTLIGKSPAMAAIYGLITQSAGLDITVLITGETGTGKELVARAIHQQSVRRDGRFVPINCGALPAELVESELFGHARGAFTGAVGAKRGLFEEAGGGTLFLDEIGELPLPVQVKLNRALQEKEIRRVGETSPIKTDVRLVAATHRDLKSEVAAGRFREDLFYRLNVFPIKLPPLRERREDVPLLAAHFIEKAATQYRRAIEGLEPEAIRTLLGYDWPGNVRELENAIERAIAVTEGPLLKARDLPEDVRNEQRGIIPGGALAKMHFREALEVVRDRFTREYLSELLKETAGNVTRAAERAGMERESLHRLLKKHGVHSDDYKSP